MDRYRPARRQEPRPSHRARSGHRQARLGKALRLDPHSTLLSTGSDLLFVGTADGFVEALDAKNGNVLWKFNVGSGVHGGIISYAVDGKQYIAVASGHGTYVGRAVQSLNKDKLGTMQESMAVVVFALP